MQSRDVWLSKAAQLIYDTLLAPAGFPDPNQSGNGYRVTCGLSQGSRNVRSQCYGIDASDDRVNEIFISPELDDSRQVLLELTWQLSRACDEKARTRYSKLADAFNLVQVEGHVMTGTTQTPDYDLNMVLDLVEQALGAYPHAALRKPPKDGTRQLKVECNDCTAIWRSSAKWVRLMSQCPCCGSINIATG